MNENFPWEDLLDYIQDGKVVPVVGHELIEGDYQGRRVSLQRLISERLAEREGLTVEWTRHFELSDAVAAYLAKQDSRLGGLADRVRTFLRSMNPPFPIPAGLLRLAEIQSFDLFVSLTFDSLLARAIDQVRFGGAKTTGEVDFSINQSTAAYDDADKLRQANVPIVFNLLGRATSKYDFAIHDEDALEFIHRFVSGAVAPPEWLLSELRNRHLLILGVHLPDWLERFMLRAATRDRIGMAQRVYFIAGENAASGGTLQQFLRRFGRETRMSAFEGTAEEFTLELQRRWVERHPAPDEDTQEPPPPPERPRGSIFISYGRENLQAVETLQRAIAALGGDVWFDRAELTAGDQWERKILPQIQREVRLFIPVLSQQTAQKQEGYVFREWREAVERAKRVVKRKFIVPIAIDADYNNDLDRYKSLLDEFPSFRDLNVGRAPGGQPDQKLHDDLECEIRAMRRELAR
jgi:hypothetical protein